jgi:hypothetical protein
MFRKLQHFFYFCLLGCILVSISYAGCRCYQVFAYKFQAHLAEQDLPLPVKIAILQNSPVRVLNEAITREYLQQHRVYLSLTTTPSRAQYLPMTLAALDLEHVTQVFLVIPKRFGRNGMPYTLPPGLSTMFPKLKILFIEQDLGPISKLLPTLAYLQQHDPDLDNIILTIDDDVLYPRGLVHELIYQLSHHDAVVGGMTDNNLTKGLPWHEQLTWLSRNIIWKDWGLRQRNLVVGFGGVGYKLKFLDYALLQQLSQGHRSCYLADDLVISYALHLKAIPRLRVTNQYLNPYLILPLEYGSQADALHKLNDTQQRYHTCSNYLVQSTS